MENGSRLSRCILAAAIVFGTLADLLLRATPWGLNLLLLVSGLTVSVFALAHSARFARQGYLGWLGAGAFLFGVGFAWRDSPVLMGLDVLGLLVIFSLGSLKVKAGSARLATLSECVLSFFSSLAASAFGMFSLLLKDAKWKPLNSGARSRHAIAVGRGLFVGVPLVIVFGLLLANADPVFEKLMGNVFDVNAPDLLAHLLIMAACAWMTGGYLRRALANPGAPVEEGTEGADRKPPFGAIEIAIPLGLLNALFLIFVVVQFRYFFGGGERVRSIAGLTYSEYARRGFFELVAVAALALPVLLIADWLVLKESRWDRVLFRSMAAVLIGLLFVIMASAIQRMFIYLREYGQTELRIYTTAFTAWLAVLFVWFAATVLRGRRNRFALGAMVSGFAIILMMHLINPDAMMVQVNAHRAAQGRTFDVCYNTSLSADSVPELVRHRLVAAGRPVQSSPLLARQLERTQRRLENLEYGPGCRGSRCRDLQGNARRIRSRGSLVVNLRFLWHYLEIKFVGASDYGQFRSRPGPLAG
jgi:hypothetical protein